MKRLTGNRLANVTIVIAIIFVPLMYAGLLTWSYEKPMQRIHNINAAVVNLDQPAQATLPTGGVEHFDLGNKLTQHLTQTKDAGFTWNRVDDPQTAQAGLLAGKYGAILTIPANFSKNAAELTDLQNGEIAPTKLQLVTDDGINYMTGTMAQIVAAGLEGSTNAKSAERFTDSVLVKISSVHLGLSEGAKGAATLAEGSQKLQGGADKLKGATTQLVVGLSSLASGAVQISSASDHLAKAMEANPNSANLYTGAQSLSQALTKILMGTQKTNQAVDQVHAGAQKTAQGAAVLHGKGQELTKGTQAIHSGLSTLQSQFVPSTNPASPSLRDGVSQSRELMDGLGRACAFLPGDPICQGIDAKLKAKGISTGVKALPQLATQFDNGFTQAGQAVEQLNQGSARLEAGTAALTTQLAPSPNPSTPTLADGVNALVTATGPSDSPQRQTNPITLKDAIEALSAALAEAQRGSEHLSAGIGQAGVGAAKISQGAARLNSGLDSAVAGAHALADGSQQLAGGLAQAQSGTKTLQTRLEQGAQQVPELSAQRSQQVAKVVGHSATIAPERHHGVSQNGSGFAPFFMALSLWVGGIAMFLIFPSLDVRRSRQERWFVSALRSAGIAGIFALAQATMVVVGLELLLNLQAAQLAALVGICLLSSLAFVAINQACVAAFGFRGRFVSVLLLILQLASAGGTFPVETMPRPLQFIHHYLPMTYTVKGIRDLVAGSGVSQVGGVAVIAIWMLAAWVVTLVAARRRSGLQPMPFDPALVYMQGLPPRRNIVTAPRSVPVSVPVPMIDDRHRASVG